MVSKSQIQSPLFHPILFLYQVLQWLIGKALSPRAPRPNDNPGRPKIAIIGAGITGVTAAAHCVGHGFDVVIFEAGSEDAVGGIWSRVNETSGLQIHSLMYRFHPSVQWQSGYPSRDQILSQVRHLWRRYGLAPRTRFNTRVDRAYQDSAGRWIINDPSAGRFEGLIAAVGTCGDPKVPRVDGMDGFKGDVYHSSELTGVDAKGKHVAIIGGGASAVEALEFAFAAGAAKTSVLSRSDKWIIPRNILVDAALSLNIFGQETRLSVIPEWLLRKFFYRDLEHLSPPDGSTKDTRDCNGDEDAGEVAEKKGLFTDTPMVNSRIMDRLRDGSADWVRGDIEEFTDSGVVVNRRARGVPKGGPGRRETIPADMIVMATGFKRPSLDFLPDDCFQEPYAAPNWYLQTFPPNHPSVSAINCTYVAAIGTVGNWHIGIYTRILLMFLVDPLARPHRFWMQRWIDMTRLLKRGSPTPAFDFFTYLELLWWFTFCVAVNPFRWKWAVFVFFGVGLQLPMKLVEKEEQLIGDEGYKLKDEGVSL